MSPSKLIARFARTGAVLLQAFLFAALLLQGLIAYYLITVGHIPLPTTAVNKWLREHPHEAYYIQGNAFGLNPNGIIQIKEARLLKEEVGKPIAAAEHLRIEPLSRTQLGLKISVYRGTLFYPTGQAASDPPRPALAKLGLSLVLNPGAGEILVEALTAQYGSLQIKGRARLNTADLQTLSKREATSGDPLQALLEDLEQRAEIKHLLQKTQEPLLCIHLDKDEAAPPKPNPTLNLSFYLDTPSLKHEAMAFENIKVHGRASLAQNGITFDRAPHFQADRFSLAHYGIQIEQATGQMDATEALALASGRWPAFQVRADKISGFGKTCNNATLKLDQAEPGSVRLKAYAYGFGGCISFAGQLNTQDDSGWGTLQGNFNPALLLPEMDTYKLPELLINGPAHCKTALRWMSNFENPRVHTFAHFIQPSLNGVNFEVASINATCDSNKLEINPLHFTRGAQRLELSYTQNLRSHTYALSTKGRIIPDQYNPFMPRWWKNIFNEDLSFNDQSRVEGDCVVYGKTDKFSTDFYYGQFQASKLAYQNVPVDQGQLTLRGRNRYTEIHQLDARSGTHWIKGDIHFTGFPDEIPASAAIRYDLKGVLPLEKLRQLLPPKTAQNLDAFQSPHAPHLHLRATQFREDDYPQFKDLSHLYLEVDADAPLTFHNLNLEHLRFNLHARDSRLMLRQLDFGLAGGNGTGAMDRSEVATIRDPQLRLDLELTGADYSTVRALFIDFEKTPPSEAVRPRVPSNKDGILDLKVQSEGSAKNLYAHSGFGRVTLAHENLAQIQLLGPLSMILEKTPLGFTSLTLNQMESDFALADGFIKLSPLKITGPQATIEANGTLQMAEQNLDLVVGVNLIGNLNKKFNPLWRLTDAINPLNYLMQFRITGTLDNQTIRSLYDPRNLLPEGNN